jgi:hypothetical protein
MEYQIVQTVDGKLTLSTVKPENIGAWCEVRGFTLVGQCKRRGIRPELHGQPVFSGLLGPMYGGQGIVRYEDPATYDAMSI